MPWAQINAGDTVLIHWRSTPYKEKWVIGRQGTSSAPITVKGVPGPAGELPVIDGNGATTSPALNYWNQERSIIKIGGSNVPTSTYPMYITIDGLELKGAAQPNRFTSTTGAVLSYTAGASAIYIEKGSKITIRNCKIHSNGNGIVAASGNTEVTQNLLIERNHIYGNGNVGSSKEHGTYTAGINVIYQYNRFGAERAGAIGNALKDRSAGLTIRYNWFEGGNRLMDLVDGEDSSRIRESALYDKTYVYGNVLVEQNDGLNRQLVHYGGDSGTTANYRKGTLHFYNNTIVSHRVGKTVLFRLSTNDEKCDARNNIFYVTADGGLLAFLEESGQLSLNRNWAKPGYKNSHTSFTGRVTHVGPMIEGTTPGFANEAAEDFQLSLSSLALGGAAVLDPDVVLHNNVKAKYMKHLKAASVRSLFPSDIGAYQAY